jgi:hypothetical protein
MRIDFSRRNCLQIASIRPGKKAAIARTEDRQNIPPLLANTAIRLALQCLSVIDTTTVL